MNIDEHRNIEFLQNGDKRNIIDRLKDSIDNCISLQGAVAFWNIKISYFNNLAEKLKQEDSFFCIDIHQPTDIDHLKEFVGEESNIYLFLYRVETGRHPLLHTKLFLFILPNNEAEIWIGSQNFTLSALEGFNIESTSIITTKIGSPLYKKVLSYLKFIKNCCEDIGKIYPETRRFNLKFVDFYKKLQQSYDFQEENYKVIDFVCENISDISSIAENKNNSVLIASFNDKDKKINTGEEILIRALDKKGEIICYKSKVLSFAGINPIESNQESKDELATNYVDENNEHYEIESYIMRDKDKIPIFIASKPNNLTKQSISVIIRISEKFEKILHSSEKGDFWRNISDKDKQNNLTYLKSMTNIDKVKIPKSPETVKKESNRYPLDKIRNLSQDKQGAIIEQLYKPAEVNNKDFLKTVSLTQNIVRKMVTKKDKSIKFEDKPIENLKNVQDSQMNLI